MQIGQLTLAYTDPATQLRDAAAQNVPLTLNMGAGPALGQIDGSVSAGKTLRARIRQLTIISVENLIWEVSFWHNDLFTSPTLLAGTRRYAGRYTFQVADGLRAGTLGEYYYASPVLDIPYYDDDSSGELHLMLRTTSAAGKSAGDAGAIQIGIALENTSGW